MTRHSRLAGLAILAGLALAAPVQAQSVRLLGEFRDWSSYAAGEGADALCFALSKPTSVEPTPDGYSQAYFYLTHRPAENVRSEMNLVAGFTFAPDTPATLNVGGQSFTLFTEADAAWLADPSQSQALASAVRAGSTLVLDATTDKGIKVTQTYSLSGATAANRAIDSECP